MNWSPVRCLAGVSASVWLSAACVMAPMASGVGGADAPAASQPAHQGATLRTPAGPLSSYLRVQPQQTGLLNAADDGRNTVIAFDRSVPPGSNVWDQDGRSLLHVQAGAVLAVAGVHRGLLVRIGTGNSYLAPNPRAVPGERPAFDDDPDAQDALSRLEGEASQMQAFRRAMSRVDAGRPPALADPPAALGMAAPALVSASATVPVSSDAPTPASALWDRIAPTNATLPPPATDDPTYQRLPGGGVLVRVFFASGGRTIVRPDDGLMRLEAQARAADLIRITGHTDSTGGLATNSALSLARAEAIRSLLMQRGVPAERILVSGIAGARHLADNESERGRALNRRVEVEFIRRAGR